MSRIRTAIAAAATSFGAALRGKSAGCWESMFSGGSSSSADLTQPYKQSAWVRQAIRYVSGPLEVAEIKWSQDRRGGDRPVDDADLTAFWASPATALGGPLACSDFVQAIVSWRLLKGEAFLVLDDSWLTPRMKKSAIIVARPDRMREILNADRTLAGWVYSAGTGGTVNLIPEQVIQLKGWNPYNDYRGLAEWEAAKIAADSDYAAAVFARNLMANNGDRGPYVIGKDGQASPEQVKQITEMLRQKRDMARRGDFRAVFLTGDIEVQDPGLQSVDTSFAAQRLGNREEIFMAFGVPLSYQTVVASYSIGNASDRFKLLEETAMPLASKVADVLERVERMRTGTQLFAEFDFSNSSTMMQVMSERFDSATKAVDRGMPWRTAADFFRLKLPRFPGDAIGRVPFNLTEIGPDGHEAKPDQSNSTPPTKDNTTDAPPPGTDDPAAELGKLFARRAAAKEAACKQHAESLQRAAQQKAAEQWAKIHKLREPWEKKSASVVSRYLFKARAEMLAKLAALGEGAFQPPLDGPPAGKSPNGEQLPILRADAPDVMFDLDAWLGSWTRDLNKVNRAALEQAGFEVWSLELGKDDVLTLPAKEVLAAVADRENKLSDAGQHVFDDVMSKVAESISKGTSNAKLAQVIKDTFKGITDSRATMIGATEITTAYETGRDLTFKAAGVEWTQWLTSMDGRERHTHAEANEQIREMGQPFDVGGEPLMYPGDPNGSAREVIHCRCLRIAVQGPDPAGIAANDPTLGIPD